MNIEHAGGRVVMVDRKFVNWCTAHDVGICQRCGSPRLDVSLYADYGTALDKKGYGEYFDHDPYWCETCESYNVVGAHRMCELGFVLLNGVERRE